MGHRSASRRSDSFWPTSPTADFDVRVVVPKGLRVLASGKEIDPGRWRAQGVRDFALAVGVFTVRTTTVRASRPIRLVVGLEQGSSYPIEAFVADTARALRTYARLYGGYPWPTHTLIVMKDLYGLAGFAYPTVGFIGDSSIALIPHETAHRGSTRSSGTTRRGIHGSAKDLRPGRGRGPSDPSQSS